MLDLLIKNGVSIDLETGTETKIAIGIQDGKIEAIYVNSEDLIPDTKLVLDADGGYVVPGLIDFHAHLFTRGSSFGVNADLLLSSGVTTAVDMGTSGYVGYEALHAQDIIPRTMQVKSFLNLSPIGQPGAGISEPLNNEVIQRDQMKALVEKYPDEILGIKVRISKPIVGTLGIEPLSEAVKMGENLNLPVCVHTTNPPVETGEVVEILRSGDVYSHMYHNKGMTILTEDGKVYEAFKEAQKRGVYLEVGNGKMNFDFGVAKKAMEDGVYPDIISSDATARTFANLPEMKDLAFVMSKFWNMGMPLHKVIAAVTKNPAKCLRIQDRAGALVKGFPADVTILRLDQRATVFSDSDGNTMEGNKVLCPEMTMIGGRIVYLQGKTSFTK